MAKKGISRRNFMKGVATGGATLAVSSLVDLARVRAQGEEVVVRFLTTSWASTRDRRPARQVAFRSVIDSFNQQFADQGIRVEEVVGDGNPLTITQEIEAGNVDAFWFNHGNTEVRYNAGQLLDLTSFEPEIGEFFDFSQELSTMDDGAIAALWHNTDTPLYYYRTDKFPTPPTTWSELVEQISAIREEEGGSTYGFVTPYVGWTQHNAGLYAALGGTFVDEEGAPTAFTDENKAIWTTMFEHLAGLIENDLVPSSAIGNNQNQMLPDVYAGNVYSFTGNSNFHIRQLQPNLPPEEYELWSAAPIPYPDGADGGLYVAGGWMIGAVASGNPALEAAAAAWTLHATGTNAIASTCLAGGWIPTRPAILAEDPFYSEDAYAQTTLAALEQGYVVPLAAIYNDMRIAIETALQRVAAGDATIEEALNEAEAETMRAYEALQATS